MYLVSLPTNLPQGPVNERAPEYLSDSFVANSINSSHNLRRTSTNLRLPRKMSLNGQKSFSYRGVAT